MTLPPLLVKQLYRPDPVVISPFVRTGCTTRRWGWLLGRIGYSITHHNPLYPSGLNVIHKFKFSVRMSKFSKSLSSSKRVYGHIAVFWTACDWGHNVTRGWDIFLPFLAVRNALRCGTIRTVLKNCIFIRQWRFKVKCIIIVCLCLVWSV